jgi:DNA polymerase III epsilon subunit-like protein
MNNRVLIFDIETAPMLAYIWRAKTEYVNPGAITHEVFLLSWAAKWEGARKIHGDVLAPEEALAQDDGRIVQSLADMIREADVVVAHFGNFFDIPMLNNRLLLLDQEPLGPVRSIDTKALAARSFRLASNKLDYIAQALGIGSKIKTDFDLWVDCYHGDARALAKMYRYNRKDVTLLEEVYGRLKPYVKGLPRLVDAEYQDERVCPSCGADALTKRGLYRTNASTFQKWVCGECGRCSRSRQADKTKKLLNVPITN